MKFCTPPPEAIRGVSVPLPHPNEVEEELLKFAVLIVVELVPLTKVKPDNVMFAFTMLKEESVFVIVIFIGWLVAEALTIAELAFTAVKSAAAASWDSRIGSASKNMAGAKILNMRLFIEVPCNSRLYYINPD